MLLRPAVVTSLAVLTFAVWMSLRATPAGEDAIAMTRCGHLVLADWFDNGSIERRYARGCFDFALRDIPEDSEWGGELRAALLAARER